MFLEDDDIVMREENYEEVFPKEVYEDLELWNQD